MATEDNRDSSVIAHGTLGVITAMPWSEIRKFMAGRTWLVPRLMSKEEYTALRDNGIHESFTTQRRQELSAFITGWKLAKE